MEPTAQARGDPMRSKMHHSLLPLIAVLCLSISVAHAEVFKCRDSQTNKVTLSDKPCEMNQRNEAVAQPSNALMDSNRREVPYPKAQNVNGAQSYQSAGNPYGAPLQQDTASQDRGASMECKRANNELAVEKSKRDSTNIQTYSDKVTRACSNRAVEVDLSNSRDCRKAERELEVEESKKTGVKNVSMYRERVRVACMRG